MTSERDGFTCSEGGVGRCGLGADSRRRAPAHIERTGRTPEWETLLLDPSDEREASQWPTGGTGLQPGELRGVGGRAVHVGSPEWAFQ